MMELINQHIDTLKKLCKKFNVSELYIFGSYAKGNNSKNSDVDFLVRFSGVNPIDYFDNYFDFKTELETLFNRNVDLVESQTVKNPVLKRSIENSKVLIYGREDTKMAV